VRRVGHLDQRLREAARLGFRRVLVPAGATAPRRAVAVESVAEAVRWLRERSAGHASVADG
jgi:predicted ATP-dependent serine protease